MAEEIASGSRCIPQIAPPGFMFDDFAAGPDDLALYETKAAAIGISEDAWIQVEAFNADQRDRNGLLKAYQEPEFVALGERVEKPIHARPYLDVHNDVTLHDRSNQGVIGSRLKRSTPTSAIATAS